LNPLLILRGILGIAVLLGIAFLISNNRRRIPLRVVAWGIGLQFLFALIILAPMRYSWLGMYLFLAMIVIYTLESAFWKGSTAGRRVVLGLVAAGGMAALAGALVEIDALLAGSAGPSPRLAPVSGSIASISALVLVAGFALRRRRLQLYAFDCLLLAAFAVVIRKELTGQILLGRAAEKVTQFLKLTDLGSAFLFGNLANEKYFFPEPGSAWPGFGFQFAFIILPTIIFFSSCMSILYYLGVMQYVVQMMARFMRWTMGTSGAETLSCSANIFVGQTEAPLLIRPFLAEMTPSELHAIMVGGFATIAGGVLAGYIRMGVSAGHLIAASVMSAPAALVVAKIIFPETLHSKTAGDVEIPRVGRADNLLDAAARGVTDGLYLALNVGAMLIAFIALIGFVDVILGFLDARIDGSLLGGSMVQVADHQEYAGYFPGSLRTLFGAVFGPLAWAMGVSADEIGAVGNLLGVKISANEFVAYLELSKHIRLDDLSPRSITIATYALCGFANFASIGIQIGGIGALAPDRRSDLARVALRAMMGGALASWMTATVAGMLLG